VVMIGGAAHPVAGELPQDRRCNQRAGAGVCLLRFSPQRSYHMSEAIYLDTETAYWVIPADAAFSVEVVTPWDDPTTVSPFATVADVKAWIADHQRRVQSETKPNC
jgi:hypothetical protein